MAVKERRCDLYVRMFREGKTPPQIARELNVTSKTVHEGLIRAGVRQTEKDAIYGNIDKNKKSTIQSVYSAPGFCATSLYDAAKQISEKTGIGFAYVYKVLLANNPLIEQRDDFVGKIINNWRVIERVSRPGVMLKYRCECLLCHKEYDVQKVNIERETSKGCFGCYVKRKYGENCVPVELLKPEYSGMSARAGIAKALNSVYPKECDAEELTKMIYNASGEDHERCKRNIYTNLCIYKNKDWVRVKTGSYKARR